MTATAHSNAFQKRLLEALAEARRRGLYQDELARRIGVSKNTIGHWKKGTHQPQHKNLKALSAVLGIPVEELTEDKPKQREPGREAAPPRHVDASAEVLKRLGELDLLGVFEKLRKTEPEIQQLAEAIPDLMGVLTEAKRHAEGFDESSL